MSVLERFNRFIGLYISTFKNLFRLNIWLPFAVYAVLKILLLLLCASYSNPTIYNILSPLVSLLGENNAEMMSHYPGLFMLLPTVSAWGQYLLGVIFEGLILGIGALLFYHVYAGKNSELNIKFVFGKWLQLLVVWCIISAILLLANHFLPKLASSYLMGSPRRLMIFGAGMKLLTVAIYSLFVYAIPSIIIYRNGIIKALTDSLSIFKEYPIFSFFLALIPYLLSVPTTYIGENAVTIVSKFTPELILYVLLAGIVIDMVVNFIMIGTVVKFLSDERD